MTEQYKLVLESNLHPFQCPLCIKVRINPAWNIRSLQNEFQIQSRLWKELSDKPAAISWQRMGYQDHSPGFHRFPEISGMGFNHQRTAQLYNGILVSTNVFPKWSGETEMGTGCVGSRSQPKYLLQCTLALHGNADNIYNRAHWLAEEESHILYPPESPSIIPHYRTSSTQACSTCSYTTGHIYQ